MNQLINRLMMMKAMILVLMICVAQCDVGFRVGKVDGQKILKSYGKSTLYELHCQQLDDNRPVKLLDLHGTHSQVGEAYGWLLAQEINLTYKIFFEGEVPNKVLLQIICLFLDWQYDAYVRKQIPLEFLDELNGIQKGSSKHGLKNVRSQIQRVLVVSSYPGDPLNDIMAVLFDEFLRSVLEIKNPKVQNMIEQNLLYVIHEVQKFIKKKRIHCSFFAVWGTRTINQELYTMRNLDWEANTGINVNKLIFVWHIDSTIPHLTLGFPGLIGALTGMSQAGITVHEAGMSSLMETEVGFHWTLRMRQIMMYAKNLNQAKKIWLQTNNTLGMNFMIGSGKDVSGGPALVFETMRNYTAVFKDYDPRQNGTIFIDPKSGKKFEAGFSMPDALFRTNHAYDPLIVKNHFSSPTQNDDSIIRYRILKDSFNWYKNNSILMGETQALNLTAILGDKGSQQFKKCPQKNIGINVISVTYAPKTLKMWAAFEYGFKETFRSACCGVYMEIDMNQWFSNKQLQSQ